MKLFFITCLCFFTYCVPVAQPDETKPLQTRSLRLLPAFYEPAVTLTDEHPELASTKTRRLVKMGVTVYAEKPMIKRFEFAYQNEITLLLNGKRIYFSNKGFADRNLSLRAGDEFFDHLYLPLKRGLNELSLEGWQQDGGIGIRCRWEDLKGLLLK